MNDILICIGINMVIICVAFSLGVKLSNSIKSPRDLAGNPIPYHKLPGYDHHRFARLAKKLREQQKITNN